MPSIQSAAPAEASSGPRSTEGDLRQQPGFDDDFDDDVTDGDSEDGSDRLLGWANRSESGSDLAAHLRVIAVGETPAVDALLADVLTRGLDATQPLQLSVPGIDLPVAEVIRVGTRSMTLLQQRGPCSWSVTDGGRSWRVSLLDQLTAGWSSLELLLVAVTEVGAFVVGSRQAGRLDTADHRGLSGAVIDAVTGCALHYAETTLGSPSVTALVPGRYGDMVGNRHWVVVVGDDDVRAGDFSWVSRLGVQ